MTLLAATYALENMTVPEGDLQASKLILSDIADD